MSLAEYQYDYDTCAGKLAALLLMKQSELRERKLAIIAPRSLYFDDAFTHDKSEAVAFGGWLSTFEHWINFEYAWNRALKDFGVKRFHGTDLDARRGEFKGWDKKRSDEFMKLLTNLAGNFIEYGFGCGIVRADYEQAFPQWLQTNLKHPLNFCVYGALTVIAHEGKLGKFVSTAKPMRSMIERKPGYEGVITSVYYLFQAKYAPALIGDLAWGGKEEVPLQAADMFAHEIAKWVANQRYRAHCL